MTSAARSNFMRSIRREKTGPEQKAARLFRNLGVTFRQNAKALPGTPDFFFPHHDLVVFVHGCFWHGHRGCLKGRVPTKTSTAYWRRKIARNRRRDAAVARRLRRRGLSVLTAWECVLNQSGLPRLVTESLRSSQAAS